MIEGTKKRKMEGEKSLGLIENNEIESEQLEKIENSSSPKESVIGITARGGRCNNSDNGEGGSKTVG